MAGQTRDRTGGEPLRTQIRAALLAEIPNQAIGPVSTAQTYDRWQLNIGEQPLELYADDQSTGRDDHVANLMDDTIR